jgi:hypothetical protein
MARSARACFSAGWLALLLCAAAPVARAGVPDVADGTIALLGGWRGVPQHALMTELSRDGLSPQHDAFQPGFMLELGYRSDADLHMTIEIGYGVDKWLLTGGDATASIVDVLLAADTPLWQGESFMLYGGGGMGYSLNTYTRNGASTESNSTAIFAKVGLRVQLYGSLALVLEDRWTFASSDYPELKSSINVGGNLLSLGFMLHFHMPNEHPGVGR